MSQMLELSPSLVDSFEYWQETEDGSAWEVKAHAELIASIKREPMRPSEAMALGLAWHKALEGQRPVLDKVSVTLDNGARYTFCADGVRQALDARPPSTSVEMWGNLVLPGAVLNLRADGVSGNEVHEVKSTSKEPDAERYMRTLQWRAYLLAFEAQVAVYHVCRLEWNEDREVHELRSIDTFRQYAYPTMRDDVETRVSALVDFIRAEGLESFRELPAWKAKRLGL